MQLTISGKVHEIEPLTWKEHRKLLQVLGVPFLSNKDLLGALDGEKEEAEKAAIAIIDSVPEAITKGLAIGLRISENEVDSMTLDELLEGIFAVVSENKLAEAFSKIKKMKGLLTVPGQESN